MISEYLSISVMHYPYSAMRREWAVEQFQEIFRSYHLPMAYRSVADWKQEGPWKVAQRAWEPDPIAGHHVVLQDDHLLCRDFVETALTIAKAWPERVVSFYSQRYEDMLACRRRHANWFVNGDGVLNGAVMMPAEEWERALEWCQKHLGDSYPHDDVRLALYLMSAEKPIYNTAPSLVQHLGATDSLLGHDNPENVSKWFAGREESPLNIDWGGGRVLQGRTNLDYELEMRRACA